MRQSQAGPKGCESIQHTRLIVCLALAVPGVEG